MEGKPKSLPMRSLLVKEKRAQIDDKYYTIQWAITIAKLMVIGFVGFAILYILLYSFKIVSFATHPQYPAHYCCFYFSLILLIWFISGAILIDNMYKRMIDKFDLVQDQGDHK